MKFFLRDAIPKLEELGVPVLLPSEWLRTSSKLRVNLKATTKRDPSVRSSGLLGTAELASFDWRLAIGDSELSEEELQELVTSTDPFVQIGGKWHALRRADVEKALRFLEKRRRGGIMSSSVNYRVSRPDEAASCSAGDARRMLTDLLHGADRHFHPLPQRRRDVPVVPVPGARR